MKVVALHTDFRIYWPARLKHLSKDLEQRGDSLTVVEVAGKGSAYAFAKEKKNNEIDWVCLFPDKKIEEVIPVEAKTNILKILDKLNPDVVVAGAIAFYSGAAAVDWAKRKDKSVVIFDDAKKSDVKRSLFVNLIKRIIYSNVDAVLCPADSWIETYKYWGFKKSAIFFGVDVVDNSFWNIDSYKIKESYFLCVGRLIRCKRFGTVIKAFNHICEENIDNIPRLIIVGEGEEEHELKKQLSNTAKEKVTFLPFCDQSDLRNVYSKALALILPSQSETWGLVVNEAMASGLPVIVSRQCGCADVLVKDGENGFLFDSGNVEELRSCMKHFVHISEEKLIEMKKRSLEIISDWDLDRFSSGTIDALEYAISNKRKPYYFLFKHFLKRWNGRYNPI